MRARIVLILIALTFLWAMMIGRAAYLQFAPDPRLIALQKRQFETVVTLNPRRGDVLDRNGHELAVSMTTYSLFADPKIIEEPKEAAKFLARVLKVPQKQIDALLKNKKKRFVWVERQLDKTVHDAIAEQKIRGLGFIEESRRIYPNDRLLSHVLGFVGGDEQGLEGLELKYNDYLQASKKRFSVRRDARGRPLIVNGQMFNQVPDGADVQLTIDREIQFILEQELHQAVVHHQADGAYGVVLDAQSSEILAMASSPSFDPNNAGAFPVAYRRNRAVTDSYEPGSTMKTFVIAGAIAHGLVEPSTMINCEGGSMKIGKRVIREADSHHKFNTIPVSTILAQSSNVGTTKIAFKMGPERVQETLKRFGFGERLGVDLPGEAKGIIQSLPWRDHLLANISFGHGFTATPLQIANAYAAIANGGWLKRPYIVKTIRDHENGEEIEGKPKTLSRVLNDEQVAKMRQMLHGVTIEGSGKSARVPGFPVAGKTGTAQKVNPNGRGYLRGGYISSFAGFIPVNNPRFVIYIAVDHPRKEYYGAAVAAPVFANVAAFAVRRAGLAPIADEESLRLTKASRSQAEPETEGFDADGQMEGETEATTLVEGSVESLVKSVRGDKNAKKAKAAKEIAEAPAPAEKESHGLMDAAASLFGRGEASRGTASNEPSVQGHAAPPMFAKATAQTGGSAKSKAENQGTQTPVETAVAEDVEKPVEAAFNGGVVPDLTGLTLREVLGRINGTGIAVQVKGQGFVTQTVPVAGARIGSSKQITIYLSKSRE